MRSVDFKCLRRSNLADRLIRVVRRLNKLSEEQLDEIKDEFKHKIRVPSMCTVY